MPKPSPEPSAQGPTPASRPWSRSRTRSTSRSASSSTREPTMSDTASGDRDKPRSRGIFERPKGSRTWWVRYHDEHGREHREKVGPKALALKVYQKRKTEIAERRFFPENIRRRDVLLTDMIDDCLARAATLRCFKEYERAAGYWKDALGGRTLAQIVPGDIERYVARRGDNVAPATGQPELSFPRRGFNRAIA